MVDYEALRTLFEDRNSFLSLDFWALLGFCYQNIIVKRHWNVPQKHSNSFRAAMQKFSFTMAIEILEFKPTLPGNNNTYLIRLNELTYCYKMYLGFVLIRYGKKKYIDMEISVINDCHE